VQCSAGKGESDRLGQDQVVITNSIWRIYFDGWSTASKSPLKFRTSPCCATVTSRRFRMMVRTDIFEVFELVKASARGNAQNHLIMCDVRPLHHNISRQDLNEGSKETVKTGLKCSYICHHELSDQPVEIIILRITAQAFWMTVRP
jgi:hypothetical protein